MGGTEQHPLREQHSNFVCLQRQQLQLLASLQNLNLMLPASISSVARVEFDVPSRNSKPRMSRVGFSLIKAYPPVVSLKRDWTSARAVTWAA